MSLPLSQRKVTKIPCDNGNRGLYWTKFFDQWKNDFSEVPKPDKGDSGKMKWIRQNQGKIGNAEALKTMAGRQACLADKLGGEAKTFRTSGPFVTGMGLSHPVENGFLFHHTLGVPYLPGSSIKGMIRAFAKQEGDADTATVQHLFGRSDEEGGPSVGSVIVFDALPIAPVALVAEIITPHTGDWRITKTPADSPPADWVSPNPIPFLAVDEGAEFQFALAARGKDDTGKQDLEQAWKFLKGALEWIGAGAKTAIGFGRMLTDERREEILDDLRKTEAEAKRQAKEAEQKRRSEWVPAVGDLVLFDDGEEKEERRISRLSDKAGDFYAKRLDGSQELLTDTNECKPSK